MTPPFALELSTGLQIQCLLEDASQKIPGFTTRLKIEYEKKDLKGFKGTVEKEKQQAKRVPELYKVVKEKEDDGTETTVQKFGMCNIC